MSYQTDVSQTLKDYEVDLVLQLIRRHYSEEFASRAADTFLPAVAPPVSPLEHVCTNLAAGECCGLRWSGPYVDCPGCFAQAAMKAVSDLIQERDALKQALAPPVSGWRDIASAPKDDDVLLYSENEGVRAGYWYDLQTPPPHGWWAVETQGLTGGIVQPTHWMPLPDPPVDDPETETKNADSEK